MTLKYLLEKAFKQFFRHKFMPKLVVLFPLMIMVLMPWATTLDIKDINTIVVDHDASTMSSDLVKDVYKRPEQMEEVMRYDDEIIRLRSTIRKRTEAQVTNGEGSVNDLLRDINAEDRARRNRTAHEVEWLKNIYDLKYTINQ